MRAFLCEETLQVLGDEEALARSIERAARVLTLVTCSEGNGHSGTRTLVLFVHGDADGPRSQEAAGYSAASAATSDGVDPKV